jgi:hypothetical protein
MVMIRTNTFKPQSVPGKGIVLFFCSSGPLLRYQDRTLHIDDLNPEAHMTWRMSTGELFRLGSRCMLAAIHVWWNTRRVNTQS